MIKRVCADIAGAPAANPVGCLQADSAGRDATVYVIAKAQECSTVILHLDDEFGGKTVAAQQVALRQPGL